MKCWFCKGIMSWKQDVEPQDVGIDGDGIVAILECMKCRCDAYFISMAEDNEPTKESAGV